MVRMSLLLLFLLENSYPFPETPTLTQPCRTITHPLC